MPSESSRLEQPILYELDERLPHTITFALGFQAAMLTIAPVVLIPVIVVRAAGESEIYLSWAVFGALVVCGLTTVIQVGRVWRIGAGYILLMGTSPAFHRGLRHRACRMGAGDAGNPRRHLVPVPIRVFGAPFPAATDHHAHRGRHRDHADLRDPLCPLFLTC